MYKAGLDTDCYPAIDVDPSTLDSDGIGQTFVIWVRYSDVVRAIL